MAEEDVLGFEGAEEILRAWWNGLRPDPDLTVSAWADRHRWLGSRASAEPGRYRTRRTPYMRQIMDDLSPASPVQWVVFMKAAQVGATEAGNRFIGFVMHHAPTVSITQLSFPSFGQPIIDYIFIDNLKYE